MSYKRILVPYDGSKFSIRAFHQALEIAKLHNSKITLISVIKEEYPPIVGFSKTKPILMKKLQQQAKKEVSSIQKIAEKTGVAFSYKLKQGNSIVKEIINFEKSQNFDLVVMGSHGRTGLSRFVLGSVAQGVLQHSTCPVLVVR